MAHPIICGIIGCGVIAPEHIKSYQFIDGVTVKWACGLVRERAEKEAIRRLKEIVRIAEDGGVVCVHENCTGWAGQSWEHTLRMLDAIPSPALRLVFDTGNPVHELYVRGNEPYAWQDSLEYYEHVKEHVVYVHIKDGRMNGNTMEHTWPGEGVGHVREILSDLYKRGYDGGISIEPHMAVVAHDPSVRSDDDIRYWNFVEYGRRTEKIVRETGWKA